ncbi:MAG: ORF6C domain-containing protein [Deltaproteobacteria bacterium]|nr:ORF6C domain-containing protein [Deltaproteobacteria bacterium]
MSRRNKKRQLGIIEAGLTSYQKETIQSMITRKVYATATTALAIKRGFAHLAGRINQEFKVRTYEMVPAEQFNKLVVFIHKLAVSHNFKLETPFHQSADVDSDMIGDVLSEATRLVTNNPRELTIAHFQMIAEMGQFCGGLFGRTLDKIEQATTGVSNSPRQSVKDTSLPDQPEPLTRTAQVKLQLQREAQAQQELQS